MEDIVVRLLGPLWRRDARLLAGRAAAVEADPLTPARFESHVSISTPAPLPRRPSGAFITFKPDGPARAAEEPVAPAPDPEPLTGAQASASGGRSRRTSWPAPH